MAYEKIFTKPYTDGWKDEPSMDTPVTAQIMDAYDTAIEHVEDGLEQLDQGKIDNSKNPVVSITAPDEGIIRVTYLDSTTQDFAVGTSGEYLPITGGTITGRLKVYAKDTTVDPRLDVQSTRVDVLKTDGGDSVVKITQDGVNINAATSIKGSVTADSIIARAAADKLTYSHLTPYQQNNGGQNLDILASGTNSLGSYNTGVVIEANTSETSTTAPKIAVGRFSSANFNGFTSGLQVTPSTVSLDLANSRISLGDDSNLDIIAPMINVNGTVKIAARINGDPRFEAYSDTTKIRIEKTNINEVGYVSVNQNGNIYAGVSHCFVDENENPGIIEAGGLTIDGNTAYFMRHIGTLEPAQTMIVGGESLIPVHMYVVYRSEDGETYGYGEYIILHYNDGNHTAKMTTRSSISSNAGTLYAALTTDGVTIACKSGYYMDIYAIGPCSASIIS